MPPRMGTCSVDAGERVCLPYTSDDTGPELLNTLATNTGGACLLLHSARPHRSCCKSHAHHPHSKFNTDRTLPYRPHDNRVSQSTAMPSNSGVQKLWYCLQGIDSHITH
jgi:hypothetical protein